MFTRIACVIVRVGECRSCAIAQRVITCAMRSGDIESLAEDTPYIAEDIGYKAEDVEEEAVVIRRHTLSGLIVLPREHVGSLEELSVVSRAHVLAIVRRASLSVQERNFGSATRVVEMSDPPASEGHVCFHVIPVSFGDLENTPS
jgi:hypothetical protein